MQRPPSIARFEQLYALALVLSLIGWALGWAPMQHALRTNPAAASAATWALPVMVVIWAAVWVLLLWLVARRASYVAKWIVVVLAGAGVVRLLLNVPAMIAGLVSPLIAIQAVATVVLVVAAAAMLFREDARLWFGEGMNDIDEVDDRVEPLA